MKMHLNEKSKCDGKSKCDEKEIVMKRW